MTATIQTIYGRYHGIISDATTPATIYDDLAGSLNTQKVNPENVIFFSITDKLAVFWR